mmetsp:Transcript_27082/g.56534  ORF Transcript_27082/g.56534 Transcript_27082/m.56534 type:complete len:508 (-) Transcript_27082:95-1618(-)
MIFSGSNKRVGYCALVLVTIAAISVFLIDCENSSLWSISTTAGNVSEVRNVSSLTSTLLGGGEKGHEEIDDDEEIALDYFLGPDSKLTVNRTPIQNRTNVEKEILIPCNTTKGSSTLVNATQFWRRKACKIGDAKSVQFFHLGKGGGSTIYFQLLDYHLVFERSHPSPNFDSKLFKGPTTTLIFNIRDPVDRFVSAFNWRSLLYCRDGDKRKPYFKGKSNSRYPPYLYPDKVCLAGNKTEKILLHEEYQSDPNPLGEALCEDSPNFAYASEKVKNIAHARLSLNDWLSFLIDPDIYPAITTTGINKVMAITAEPRVENNNTSLLDWHTQQAIIELYSDSGLSSDQIDDIMKHKPQVNAKSEKKSEMMTHSSISSSTSKLTPPPLRTLGECCLARFFHDDYRLMKTMILDDREENLTSVLPLADVHSLVKTACSWGNDEQRTSCMRDLASMIKRRAEFLDYSRGSCENVVGVVKNVSSPLSSLPSEKVVREAEVDLGTIYYNQTTGGK